MRPRETREVRDGYGTGVGRVWDRYGMGMGRDRELDNKITGATTHPQVSNCK